MNRLFKHISRLTLAGIILTVAGCAYDDTVRDLREQAAVDEGLAISFSNGVIENPIKRTRAVTLLSDHTESMGVWGWQTTPEGVTERLFLNQEVTFSAPEAKWTYNPVKYWEQKSTYRFCAYAPHSSRVPEVEFAIDSATHAFSFKGVTLQGCNTISNGGVPELPSNFSNVADVDWMIDRSGQSMAGINRTEVVFNMQHILSKLCIRLRRGDYQPASKITVIIDSLRIGNFICQGDFTQAMTDSVKALAAEWTPIDTLPRYNLEISNVTVPDQPIYVIESLCIPQRITSDHTLSIWYRIGKPGHYMSRMDDSLSLKSLFNSFDAGKSYMISITIGPDPIKFDAGVNDWSSYSIPENALH